jgi:uncharacterized membrane protein
MQYCRVSAISIHKLTLKVTSYTTGNVGSFIGANIFIGTLNVSDTNEYMGHLV